MQLEVIEAPEAPVKIARKTYEATDNFYIQKMHLKNIRHSRFEFIGNLCQGKTVLHVGCADTMVFNVESNLHIFLSKLKDMKTEEEIVLKEKVDKAKIERTKERAKVTPEQAVGNEALAKAELASSLAEIAYSEFKKRINTRIDGLDIDVETTNKLKQACPGTYFTSYKDVDKEYDIVIVPEVMEHVPNVDLFLKDIFSVKAKEYLFTVPCMAVAEIFCSDEFSLEMVHPDHKYWFSPYTLYNTIKPFSNGFDVQMYFLENKTQIGIRLFHTSSEAV